MKSKVWYTVKTGLLGLLLAVSTACAGEGGEAPRAALEKILETADPSERRKDLLAWNIDHGWSDAAVMYLARERIAEGRPEEGALLLDAARDLSLGTEDRCLGEYLSAYLDFFREDYPAAEESLRRCLKLIDSKPIGSPDRREDLRDRVELLLARSLMARGEKGEQAAELLLDLRRRRSSYVDEQFMLELSSLLLSLHRREEAGELVAEALQELPFNPSTLRLWETLAGDTGHETLQRMTRLEETLIGGLPCAFAAPSKEDELYHSMCLAVEGGAWRELGKLLASLEDPGFHRLSAFLATLSSLRAADDTGVEAGTGEKGGASGLALFLETGKPYRKSQFYYYQLWKIAETMGEKYQPLAGESLEACILTGPSTDRGREARGRLAEIYGLKGLPGPLPMTEAEMKGLADFVIQGAPAEILRPLLDFLEWPENPCTLEAELVLREVRELPAVRKLMTEQLELAGSRGEERLLSILRF
jgi:hypothetical protein